MLICKSPKCDNVIDHRADDRRRYCSANCRLVAFKVREAEKAALNIRAVDLFTRAEAARADGQVDRAEALVAEAAQLIALGILGVTHAERSQRPS